MVARLKIQAVYLSTSALKKKKEEEERGSSLASANIFSNNISKKTKRGLNTKRISTASSEKMGGVVR